MQCKFLSNGLTITYDRIAKPCCEWKVNQDWREQNHYDSIDISTWHNSPQVQEKRIQLEQGIWPKNCISCQKVEQSGRTDSMRGNGNSAYWDYSAEDITLEIRPGNICNFACQTCWPEASSRVGSFLYKAGLIDKERKSIDVMQNFDFLLPVAHRIRNIVLLGGEPFYDPHSKKFLQWTVDNNIQAEQVIFTNGSMIDYDFLRSFPKKIILVFSLDATGKPAEYIRYGTEWERVIENYRNCLTLENVEVRVNITSSCYNLYYIVDLFEELKRIWPDLVTFGTANQPEFSIQAIPTNNRHLIIQRLIQAKELIQNLDIHQDQKSNAVVFLETKIHQLQNEEFDQQSHQKLISFIEKMDRVKNIKMQNHCPEMHEIIFNSN